MALSPRLLPFLGPLSVSSFHVLPLLGDDAADKLNVGSSTFLECFKRGPYTIFNTFRKQRKKAGCCRAGCSRLNVGGWGGGWQAGQLLLRPGV